MKTRFRPKYNIKKGDLVIVISGWGMRPNATAIASNASAAINARHQSPVPPMLTPLVSLLVSLGLAEPPPTPVLDQSTHIES